MLLLTVLGCGERGAAPGGASAATAASPTGAARAGDELVGRELGKPGGGSFLLDPHHSGTAAELHLVEAVWGRLVDLHDADASGQPSPEPVFRDLVVDESFQTVPGVATLAQHPGTQRTRLVLHAKRGSEEFADLLAATQHLVPIVPRHDDGSSAPPFSVVPRNACLVLRFDDLLQDDAASEQALAETVRLRAGYPPSVPFAARVRFDPNHGGLVDGEFHATRVLVDLTVSELEAEEHPFPLPVGAVGLPASREGNEGPSASVRLPTQADFGAGQFHVLANLAGAALDPAANGPVDVSAPTADVVRAFRAGRVSDTSNGFLLDLEPPHVLASLGLIVEHARALGDGSLVVRIAFQTACRIAPDRGDVLLANGVVLEVLRPALAGPGGRFELLARPAVPLPDPGVVLGSAELRAGYTPARAARTSTACWISFTPPYDGRAPLVVPSASLAVRFSEPIEPVPDDFERLRIVRGATRDGVDPSRIVPAEAVQSNGADAFSVLPALPLAHEQGASTVYHFVLGDVRDLAGNALRDALPPVDFYTDPAAASERNGGLVLRFSDFDEVGPDGLADVRGQFFLDLGAGALRGRPPVSSGYPVDRTIPVPGLMIPFAPGVQTPLVPLGSKAQTVWRYCDFGWNVRDETKHDLDVLGVSWAPVGGLVLADFYPLFEMRLAHSRYLPDEAIDLRFLTPLYPDSGLRGGPALFTDNILVDPASPQSIVHPRALGYAIDPADTFVSSSGTVMMPYPLNRGPGPDLTYTWRDTAVLAKAGPDGAGIPLDVEAGPPLFLEPAPGTLAPSGSVPSVGLPLLLEYRCFAADTAIGLNALDISLAVNSSALPAFRAYSSGGFNTQGLPVVVNPDTEAVPQGGFNPSSNPPGRRTAWSAENAFYLGQLDVVTRLSRAHTIWLDTEAAGTRFLAPLVSPDELPPGTSVVLAFRGATGFSPDAGDAPFDASRLDAYGEPDAGTVAFLAGDPTWKASLATLDGARYVQARVTFVNDLASGASPTLSALALAFEND